MVQKVTGGTVVGETVAKPCVGLIESTFIMEVDTLPSKTVFGAGVS